MVPVPVDDLAAALGLDVASAHEILDAGDVAGLVILVPSEAGPVVLLSRPAVAGLGLATDQAGRLVALGGMESMVPARRAGLRSVSAEDQADPRQREPWEEVANLEPGGKAESIRAWLAGQSVRSNAMTT